ncbi:TetR/AcrR family transcriptional regulator [Nocardia miyunensis]|uniref:TetR/AcrR family transcriptional regulator n=1 Tax=Nocardia miyunensis TaxID=282684 RepID=UPI00082BDC95|nr:TetR/AcrR family transcriptional regulator [Nocardia miyunensis]
MTITAKGQATRKRIIEGAAVHLRSEEPGTVTLDDIRAITGTSKGQIFHYFPGGKEELLVAVARYEAERVLEDQQPHLGALTTWAAWERWREAVLARYRAQGRHCPLGSLMGQVATTAGTAEVVGTLLAQWCEHIRRGIAAMQGAGLVSDRIDPDAVAMTFVAAIQGGVQVLRTTGSVEYLETSMNTLVEHLRNG